MWCRCTFIIIAITCPEILTKWTNMHINSTNVSPGDVVNYTCAEGYLLSGKIKFDTTTCSVNGIWHPEVSNCLGR